MSCVPSVCKRTRWFASSLLYVVNDPHTIIFSSSWIVNQYAIQSNPSPINSSSLVPLVFRRIIDFASVLSNRLNRHPTRIFPSCIAIAFTMGGGIGHHPNNGPSNHEPILNVSSILPSIFRRTKRLVFSLLN